MQITTEKSNAYKEGWNANCQGHSIFSGHQYALGTPERKEWVQGYEDAQKEWNEGKEPRFMSITYKNPLEGKDGWKKLNYH